MFDEATAAAAPSVANESCVVGRIEPAGEILTGDALAAVLTFPDAALVAWALDSDTARAVLSDRERAHVNVLRNRRLDLRDKAAVAARHTRTNWQADATANAARFVRSTLKGGSDNHLRRQRLACDEARAAAAAAPDDGIDDLLDAVASRRAVVLDGLRYIVMSTGDRELRLAGPRRALSTLRPTPGTATWCHSSGPRGKRRHRWYRRLDDGRFIAEPRP